MSATHITVALRRHVRERAGECCEYCLIPEAMTWAAHTIDHIIAEKHGGDSTAENLALACTLCNSRREATWPRSTTGPASSRHCFIRLSTAGSIISNFWAAASNRERQQAEPRRDCCASMTLSVSGSASCSSSPPARFENPPNDLHHFGTNTFTSGCIV
jgi:hypothetical protein